MPRKLPLFIILGLLIAVVAAGCGDDDNDAAADGSTSTSASSENGADEGVTTADGGGSGEEASLPESELSQEEYVKRVSNACSKRRSKLIPEMTAFLGGEEATKGFSPDEFGPVVRKVIVPTLEDEAQIIRSLGAPAGDEEEIEAILAAHRTAIEEVEKLKNPMSFEEIADHFVAVNKTMGEYGFTACTNQ